MLQRFLKMCDLGEYGAYIWASYALLLLVITWQIFSALKRNIMLHNQVKDDLWSGKNSDKE